MVVGAAHDADDIGTVATDKPVVSPDEANVASGDRTVTVTVADEDLDATLFVGVGHNAEATSFDIDADGDKDANDEIIIRLDSALGFGSTFDIDLSLGGGAQNVSGTAYTVMTGDPSTLLPLVDRDFDTNVDGDDIEIATSVAVGIIVSPWRHAMRSGSMRRSPATIVAVLSSLVVAMLVLGAAPSQQDRPPFPITYKGNVSIQGQPAPAGLSVLACVISCSGYESDPVLTDATGRYQVLVVGPPDVSYLDAEITFWIVANSDRIQAQETSVFEAVVDPSDLTPTLNLTFNQEVPTRPPDPPTPTATPVLPIPGDSSVRSLPRTALILGMAALLAGGVLLMLLRRRRAL